MKVSWFHRKPYDFHFSLEKLFKVIRGELEGKVEISEFVSPHHSRGILPRLKNIRAARKHLGEVNHVLGDIHYLVLGLPANHTVLTIHDIGFMHHPSRLARFFLKWFWLILPVKRAKIVTVISEATRQHVLKYVPEAADKIRVIPDFLIGKIEAHPKRFNQGEPRILQVGTKFNKNLERVLAALEGISCKLVIIGKLSEQQLTLLKKYQLRYENHYRIPEADLVRQYQMCDLLVFCSTLEGFGLPILEAQSVGRPVVTSNISAMPEVAGEGACLVDPFQVESIRQGVKKVISDQSYRDQLVEAGFRNLERFEVARVAGMYLEVYEEVGGGK